MSSILGPTVSTSGAWGRHRTAVGQSWSVSGKAGRLREDLPLCKLRERGTGRLAQPGCLPTAAQSHLGPQVGGRAPWVWGCPALTPPSSPQAPLPPLESQSPRASVSGGCPVQQKPLWVEHRHRSRRPLPSLTQKGPKTPLSRMPSLPGGLSLAPPLESQESELRIQKIQPCQCCREAAGPLGEGRTPGRGSGREASRWRPFLIRQMRDLT